MMGRTEKVPPRRTNVRGHGQITCRGGVSDVSSVPHDANLKADFLGSVSELTSYTMGDYPGNLNWLRSAYSDCDHWLCVTLSHYDPLDLSTDEAQHLVRKVRSYLGMRSTTPGEAQRLWDAIHAKIIKTFADWLPTERQRWYREYLRSEYWRRRRWSVLQSRGFVCQDCGAEATEVHHLSYERLGEESPEDLLILCADCHRARHGKMEHSEHGS